MYRPCCPLLDQSLWHHHLPALAHLLARAAEGGLATTTMSNWQRVRVVAAVAVQPHGAQGLRGALTIQLLRAMQPSSASSLSLFPSLSSSAPPSHYLLLPSPTDQVSLNIMLMHKKVIHKSDNVLCDGKTMMAEMLTGLPGHSDYHKFPTQCPTPADLVIWKTALCKLSSAFHVLTVKLQEYISPPHLPPLWLLDNLGTTLHHNIVWGDKLYHEVYSPSLNTFARSTRSGQHYN